MRLRVNGVHVANVEDQLIELYKKYFPAEITNEQLVKQIIEKDLLFSNLNNEKSINEAKELASNLFFDDIGSWVEHWIRTRIFDKLPICRNCPCKDERDFCPIQNIFVNPNFKACGSFKLM